MAKHTIGYVEFPCTDVPAIQQFYGQLFDWKFEDWGPEYTAFSNAGLEGGFNAEPQTRPAAPLIVIESSDLHATHAAVQAAGAVITMPIFRYPGGQRFHFKDPAGNELAVMQPDA